MSSEPKRKLAAIMFTDIVGYTSLMQKDTEVTADENSLAVMFIDLNTILFVGRVLRLNNCSFSLR